MSRFNGGIYSRPRGKTAGIVWGAARTRSGKVATSRELVSPSNPNTAAQQTQRGKFSQALFIVRALGSIVYQVDWNRSIGQLPGFQSMQSIFLNNLNPSGVLSAPADTNLGTLDVPVSLSVSVVSSGVVTVTWTGGSVGNGTASDLVKVTIIPTTLSARSLPSDMKVSLETLYSAGTVEISGLGDASDQVVCIWRKGAGTAAGLLSVATWTVAEQE